jgi:uncharacterized caspase-like protein
MKFSTGHAVVVGVGADLPNTVSDAQAIADVLRDESRCGYPSDQVALLTAESANRAAVLKALADLADRTDAESTVLIYYSGHGYSVSKDGQKQYFLLPHGYSLADLPGTAISDDEFTAALARLEVKKLLLLLDCCHAAGLDPAKAPGLALEKGAVPPNALEMLKAGSGRVIVASSKASEVSFAGKPFSAFTQALIESLSGIGASEQDGFVRVADLAMYTGFRVPGRTKDRQHPVLNFDKADNFAVAYYAGGDPMPKGTPFAMPAEIEPEPGQWSIRIGILNLGGQHADRIVNAGDNATIDMSSGPKRPKT